MLPRFAEAAAAPAEPSGSPPDRRPGAETEGPELPGGGSPAQAAPGAQVPQSIAPAMSDRRQPAGSRVGFTKDSRSSSVMALLTPIYRRRLRRAQRDSGRNDFPWRMAWVTERHKVARRKEKRLVILDSRGSVGLALSTHGYARTSCIPQLGVGPHTVGCKRERDLTRLVPQSSHVANRCRRRVSGTPDAFIGGSCLSAEVGLPRNKAVNPSADWGRTSPRRR